MNAPLQSPLQAAVARAHKPKVFWTAPEMQQLTTKVASLLNGADPGHTNLGPYIKIAQAALFPPARHRNINSSAIRLVREALQARQPQPVAETRPVYVMWREVTAHELVDILESKPDQRWRRAGDRLKVVERRFANAQEVADFYVSIGVIEEVTE